MTFITISKKVVVGVVRGIRLGYVGFRIGRRGCVLKLCGWQCVYGVLLRCFELGRVDARFAFGTVGRLGVCVSKQFVRGRSSG